MPVWNRELPGNVELEPNIRSPTPLPRQPPVTRKHTFALCYASFFLSFFFLTFLGRVALTVVQENPEGAWPILSDKRGVMHSGSRRAFVNR